VDKRLDAKVFDAVLEQASARGNAVVDKGTVRHPAAAVTALAAEEEAAAKLLPLVRSQGLAPATVAELAAETAVDPGVARKVLTRLTAEGALVRVGPEMHFAAEEFAAARTRLESALREQPEGATAAELRDVLQVSRKYAIPLLEYFDAQGVTKREGDLRVLRR
jgi:selenocysteine-specific elongation factor